MKLGTIGQIWRYPVKSMAGETLEETRVGEKGVWGDRAWAVRDEVRGGIRGAKKFADLMRCGARYLDSPPGDRVIPAEIVLPDGNTVSSGAEDAAARVSAAIGHEVTLWPLQPAENVDHYRRGAPSHDTMEAELRAIFGRTDDEPLPDLSKFPEELMELESPLGTYFDAYPLLLLTDASMARLRQAAPESKIDVRRFRPNFVIETTPEIAEDGGFVEAAWEGKRFKVGSAIFEATIGCPRCVMVTRGFDDLPQDTGLLRTIVNEAGQNMGMYANVARPGVVKVGDSIEEIS